MRLCVPTKTNEGMDATVASNFVQANYFTIYDTDFHYLRVIKNKYKHHDHTDGSPKEALKGVGVEVIFSPHIPGKTLNVLHHAGFKTYWIDEHNVSGVIEHLKQNLTHEVKDALDEKRVCDELLSAKTKIMAEGGETHAV